MSGQRSAPVASIVVAAYLSRPEHLSAALASALAQTARVIEVLVYDDSPDDRLRAVAASFGDERLAYWHNRPALGVAANHWHAFRQARGEFIAVLNHDDLLEPMFVERLAQALRDCPEADVAFCDHWIIDVEGRRLDAQTQRNSEHWGRAGLRGGLHRPFVELVAAQTIPMAMGALFRRRALPANLPAVAGPAYDLWLTYLLAQDGAGACYVPERLSDWRTHAGNLTSAAGIDWILGSTRCWEAIAADERFAIVHATARRKAAAGHASCSLALRQSARRGAGARHALRSLWLWPTLRGIMALMLALVPLRLWRWGRLRCAA